jgi:hypothetical protein
MLYQQLASRALWVVAPLSLGRITFFDSVQNEFAGERLQRALAGIP